MRNLKAFAIIVLAVFMVSASAACSDANEFTPPWSAEVDAALVILEAGEAERAVDKLTPLAEAGDADAQVILGSIQERGIGISKDHCSALDWFRRAAAQGDSRAMAGLGVFHQLGYCVPTDYEKAAQYYKRAGELGEVGAYGVFAGLHLDQSQQIYDPRIAFSWAKREWDTNGKTEKLSAIYTSSFLGYMYHLGLGVSKNRFKAEDYYSYPANEGVPDAQFALGFLFLTTSDDPDKRADGYQWIFLSALQGVEVAIERRSQFITELSERSIAEAEDGARKKLFEIAADPRTQLGLAARWCRKHESNSFECLRYAYKDDFDCNPGISEAYYEDRYVHSVSYDLCRRAAVDARKSSSAQ